MNFILSKILQLIKTYQSDLILVACVIMLTVISFNLGKISVMTKNGTQLTQSNPSDLLAIGYRSTPTGTVVKSQLQHTDLTVVASKKSKTKFYHFSWCPGAKQISPQNKLTFATEAEAIAAGYHLASNCEK